MSNTNFPSLYDPKDAFRDYKPRAQEFTKLGAEAAKNGMRPASKDKVRGALIGIDMQNDFVHKDGALYVPGAEEDAQRLAEFIYTNAEDITAIYFTLDTHFPKQIFYGEWWEDPKTGKHPEPFTMITYADLANGVWRARIDPVWSEKYLKELDARGKKVLVIWPKHTMIGTWGHSVAPVLMEAIFWHSAARNTQPTFLTKGDVAHVERYGAFAPEVEYPKHPKGGTDTAILDAIGRYDRTWWAGEAETHCVVESQKQAVDYFASQPEVLENMFFLMDCTSPIINPDVDFVAMAQADQKAMKKKGVKLVKSTDPV